jgi:hypothetical protein
MDDILRVGLLAVLPGRVADKAAYRSKSANPLTKYSVGQVK